MWCSCLHNLLGIGVVNRKENQEVKIITTKKFRFDLQLEFHTNESSQIARLEKIVLGRSRKNVTSNNGSRHPWKHSPTFGQTCQGSKLFIVTFFATFFVWRLAYCSFCHLICDSFRLTVLNDLCVSWFYLKVNKICIEDIEFLLIDNYIHLTMT